MMVQVAASLLQNDKGGKGILLGGVPGVPPAEVVIIGAGTLGTCAARAFLGIGATVYLLDRDLRRLQQVDAHAARPGGHDGVARFQCAQSREICRRADRGGAGARPTRADRGDARDDQDDEAAQPDHRYVDRSRRLRGDQPPDDARLADVYRGECSALLHAESALGDCAHGDARV